jgi:putative membrane protein
MSSEPDKPTRTEEPNTAPAEGTRRTQMAGERTQLAWWRTGLAALAVALGVGRVVPQLDPTATKWPYAVAGVGFAIWGIVAIAYGTVQRAAINRAVAEKRPLETAPWPIQTLTIGGIGLGLLTALLILLG